MNSPLSASAPLSPSPLSAHSSAATTPILLPASILSSHKKNFAIKAASSSSTNPSPPIPFIPHLKAAACAVVIAAATFSKFQSPARAELPKPSETLTATVGREDIQQEEDDDTAANSPLTQLLESSSEAIDALKKLLQEKLDAGEDAESLSILRKLSAAQPENQEWRFMIARLLSEIGRIEEAREAFEEILSRNPLSFEALFENALLMDRSGEREEVMRRLQKALGVAESEMKAKEARDVRLIMAQMQFLHKDVEEALRSYDELAMEDPSDFRPYFCKGMIYSLLDKNDEAKQQFAKYKQLSPKKFEVEGYLRSPLSRMKLFGTDEAN
ncbi:protein SLOW GREEN 1, chloroplastic-like [Salvia hispanica]|uniref:protein SLOW GREEN 1, chloroplastic-like n=1 Tax=Salvia hispanica TaxID=49212 RepID=UPI0020094FA0|nr:protein SLOW GREEN 1, chloroplastic-like [Salvia hispanica]